MACTIFPKDEKKLASDQSMITSKLSKSRSMEPSQTDAIALELEFITVYL